MQLSVKKSNQGPVLAKGTVEVSDSTSCGYVKPNGVNSAGCETKTNNGGTVTYGTDGKSVNGQYKAPCSC